MKKGYKKVVVGLMVAMAIGVVAKLHLNVSNVVGVIDPPIEIHILSIDPPIE